MSTVIIGAGVVGATLALELAQGGEAVTVVDEHAGPADGTSFANGSLITPSMSDPWASPGIAKTIIKYLGHEDAPFLLRPGTLPSMMSWGLAFLRNSRKALWEQNTRTVWPLSILSRDILDRITAELGLHYDRCDAGTLRIHSDAASMHQADAALAIYRHLGCEIRTLDQATCLALEPALKPVARDIHGGFLFPADRSGDCRLFTQQLAEIAKAKGVAFRFGCRVNRIAVDNNRISGLDTSEARVTADRYVLAAGSYSLLLGRQIGMKLPLFPVKGYSATFGIGGWNAAPTIPFVDNARKVAVVRMGDRLRIAGTAEFAGFDTSDNPQRSGLLLKHFKALFPASEGVEAPNYWHGLRPMTPDGRPLIGRTPLANLFVNTGHGPLGWTLACGAARLLAQFMAGEPTDLNLAPFGLTRA